MRKLHASSTSKKKAKLDATRSITVYHKGATTSTIHHHLMKYHAYDWIMACDSATPPIQICGVQATKAASFQASNDMQIAPSVERAQFSIHLLGESLMRLIVVEDLPFLFIEASMLQNILLMLRDSLCDSQIPQWTTLLKMVHEAFNLKMYGLMDKIKDSMGKVSFMTDGWTNCVLYPFIVVVAHWIQSIPIKDPKLWEQLGIDFTL
ncbi:hypothetical protein PM082_024092 [Marasmius tenuissimus]|nr:hypothetical protein PM082_024092 [Marasmius tenuissimus]